MIDTDKFIADVLAWEGVPYHHQGRSRAGVDCIGLAIATLAAQGVAVDYRADYARTSHGNMLLDTIADSGMVRSLQSAEPTAPGDLLVFRVRTDPQHVAVALAGGRMIHADASNGVRIVTISPLWAMRLVCRFRFKE